MTRRIGRWLAETRTGRLAFAAAAALLILGAAYAVIRKEVTRQTQSITRRVEIIEKVSPLDVVRACLRSDPCRRLLEDPQLLQGGDAIQKPSKGHQPSGPHGGGGSIGGEKPDQPDGSGGRPPGGGDDGPGKSADAPDDPKRHALPEVVEAGGEAAGKVVEGAAGAVQGVAEGVGKAGCELSPTCY